MSVFEMLKETKKIPRTFPHSRRHDRSDRTVATTTPMLFDDARIAFLSILNEVLQTDEGNRLGDQEVADVIEEVSSQADGSISMEDFIRIFTTN